MVKDRIQWEKDIIENGYSNISKPFALLPGPDEDCFTGNVAASTNTVKCKTNLIDWSEHPVVEIEDN